MKVFSADDNTLNALLVVVGRLIPIFDAIVPPETLYLELSGIFNDPCGNLGDSGRLVAVELPVGDECTSGSLWEMPGSADAGDFGVLLSIGPGEPCGETVGTKGCIPDEGGSCANDVSSGVV